MSELMRLCHEGPPDRGAWPPSRLIGRYYGGRPGPTMVVFGGIHGNEPAGVHALHRIFDVLATHRIDMCGQLIGLSGNRNALAKNRRFIDEDFNRIWGPERLDTPPAQTSEVAEQAQMRTILDELADRDSRPLTLLDLHTMSSSGPAFCGMIDSYRNRKLARSLPLPTIIGLDDYVHGAMLPHYHREGHTCIAVEGGQHEAPQTVDRLESAIWIVACAAGLFDDNRADELVALHSQRLAEPSTRLPGLIRNCHRHAVEDGDEFVMRPGFRNFSRVTKGQPLATCRSGPVHAPWTGYLLMPLYQPGGRDGFFLARPVSKMRTLLADGLRRPLF